MKLLIMLVLIIFMFILLGCPTNPVITTYIITITINGNGMVDKCPNKSNYNSGEIVILTAEASTGWHFNNWSGDLTGTTNPATITMNSNKSIFAQFNEVIPETFNLLLHVTGNGTISLNPIKDEYLENEEVELNAIPDEDWNFDHWEGDLTGSTNPATLIMNEDKEATAVFTEEPNASPTIEKESGPGGDVYVNNQTFEWSGSDTDGTIAGYEYRKDEEIWSTTAATEYVWNSIAIGNHTFEVKAKDNKGSYSNIIIWEFVCKEIVIDWEKCYGGTMNDWGESVIKTAEGAYVIAGYTFSNNGDVSGYNDDGDYWIVKLNETGNIAWQKCIGGSNDDYAYSIKQTAEGGYILTGRSSSVDGDVSGNHGGNDFWIVKLDGTGNIQWENSYGGTRGDYSCEISQTDDGGYVVIGYTFSDDGDVSRKIGSIVRKDYWIIRINETGQILWERCFGGSEDDLGYAIQQTTDGGFIAAGRSKSDDVDVSFNHGNYDCWVVKLTEDGSILWERSYGGSEDDNFNSVQQTTDGGYILAGNTYSNDGDVSGNNGNLDYWVVKIDESGNILWQKCLGGTYSESAFSIQKTTDNNYIIAGRTTSDDGDVSGYVAGEDYWIVKLDNSGNLIWQKCLGGTKMESARSIQQVDTNSYIITGSTSSDDGDVSNNNGGYDYWVVKISENP